MFTFLDYQFDKASATATFRYQGKNNIFFTEKASFAPAEVDYNQSVLDAALFFAFIVIGTSYYKVAPTTSVNIPKALSADQAAFFNKIYQEGLGQFAFENHLTRADLVKFESSDSTIASPGVTNVLPHPLVLVSGGKDSLLVYEMLADKSPRAAYITSSDYIPEILDDFSPIVIRRFVDVPNLKAAGGLNGHVPVTLINESLACIQAILTGCDRIILGIGREGIEPHAYIDDLPVNHQWSKTAEAQDLLKDYIPRHITTSIKLDEILADFSELDIARQFAEKCWQKYGHSFSSCNVANYKQNADNRKLKWCGNCAKCANSYLLFAPFVPYEEQLKLFGRDLFSDPSLAETFKGLLGVDNVMKPFECVASIAELRWAYAHRLPGYGKLPFDIV